MNLRIGREGGGGNDWMHNIYPWYSMDRFVFAMNIANLWAQWIAKLTNNRKNNFQEASWPYSRPWALPRWSWWLPGCRQPAAAAGVTRWLPRRWAWHHRRLRPARLVAASSPGGKLAPYCTTVMNIIFFYQMKNHISTKYSARLGFIWTTMHKKKVLFYKFLIITYLLIIMQLIKIISAIFFFFCWENQSFEMVKLFL